MEWVETTGANVDEARLRALETLGVAFDDAEVEVLEEASSKMFGLRKTEARVRARVKPLDTRSNDNRRDRGGRRRNDNKGRGRNRNGGGKGGKNQGGNDKNQRGGGQGGQSNKGGRNKGQNQRGGGQQGNKGGQGKGQGGQSNRGGGNKNNRNDQSNNQNNKQNQPEKSNMSDEVALDAKGQADVVEEFMTGLLEAFGAEADLDSVAVDDDTFEVRATGDNLGLLIGQKGATMRSIQDIARTAVQQRADGSLSGRVHLDIGGYRAKRREALSQFVTKLADSVLETGERKVLEPMPAPDRKVIHDTIADIDGVVSLSEGHDRSRHIVLSPAD